MPTPVRYPTGGEYREALFNTTRCFKDPTLLGGTVTMDPLGMPKPISGASGSVFTVRNADSRRWAVKCFTRSVDHQAVRYQRISQSLQMVSKPWRVEFEYLLDGVLCGGTWYPVLKMEWIEATGIIPYIEQHLWEPGFLADLAGKFAEMIEDLSTLNIAHGDLQHGNLLVTSSGELKLIDYDGMFVPGLTQMGACEKGHLNYQSPARTMSSWGPYLDNFSAWIIYSSLVALTIDPTLWLVLHDQGDEALLFHHADYEDPRNSRALLALTKSSNPDLQALGTLMSGLWTPDVSAIPPLNLRDLPKPGGQHLSSVLTPSRKAATTARPTSGLVPDWVTQAQTTSAPPVSRSPGSPTWVTGHLPPPALVAFSPPRLALRLLASLGLAVIVAVGILPIMGELPGVAAAAVSWLVILVFIAATMTLFRRTPEWRAKHERLVLFKERRVESTKTSREVAKLEAAKRDIDSRETKALTKMTKQADKDRVSEQKELAGVDARLAKQIQELQKQKQSLQTSEAKESANALRLLQDQHVNSYLKTSSISSAGIPGIGPGVARSLAANGVMTAADFTGIAYSAGTRGGTRQILIKLRNGGYVHPSGVGEKKAYALDAWRRTLEMRAQATQPSALPSAQAQAIRIKYTHQRQTLANQEQAIRAQASNEQNQISQKWMATHTSISAELTATRQAFAQERAQADVQLASTKKQTDAVIWQGDLAAREVAAYRNVSYRRYLAGIIRT